MVIIVVILRLGQKKAHLGRAFENGVRKDFYSEIC